MKDSNTKKIKDSKKNLTLEKLHISKINNPKIIRGGSDCPDPENSTILTDETM
ncbi:hypothetical protein [Aquimarina macrocephali]|uniref:hypothetical protein n=1 Tax=Aquimarina macrocephali TaxID=666563 RepID=UPI0004B67B70|nr:hypothetical protein [Aquimarina macrocephali]